MDNNYVSAMIDSLKNKISIMEEIRVMDKKQLELINAVPFSAEAYDKLVDDKDVLIYKLNKLDAGFQIVYDNIKTEFEKNKDNYKSEIKQMQELITMITELSTAIQAEEARNKAALENYFSRERAKIKNGRSSVKAINTYNQTIINSRGGANGFMDSKK